MSKKKIPKKLEEFIKNKSITTGICVLDDYKNGKVSIERLIKIYKNHP